ncbi:hypothetical protein WMY93_011248 [Mugilogobius chulae]|uniref:Uncharacterized protein n=1 Tax=Mugilogobius chulae TaxID=88201 RepID=A0AAW0PAT9_9GOBI
MSEPRYEMESTTELRSSDTWFWEELGKLMADWEVVLGQPRAKCHSRDEGAHGAVTRLSARSASCDETFFTEWDAAPFFHLLPIYSVHGITASNHPETTNTEIRSFILSVLIVVCLAWARYTTTCYYGAVGFVFKDLRKLDRKRQGPLHQHDTARPPGQRGRPGPHSESVYRGRVIRPAGYPPVSKLPPVLVGVAVCAWSTSRAFQEPVRSTQAPLFAHYIN